jgi:hypothetical protein
LAICSYYNQQQTISITNHPHDTNQESKGSEGVWTYILVGEEDPIAVLLEDVLEIVLGITLIVNEFRVVVAASGSDQTLVMIEWVGLRILIVVIVIDKEEDSHVAEEGELHRFLQKALLSFAVGNLSMT